MTWLWTVADIDFRVSFARAHGPSDFFTLVARLVVSKVSLVLELALSPVDRVGRVVGRGLVIFVIGLFILLGLTAIWFLIWLLLMGSSWLWLKSFWYRPLIILPGMALAVVAFVFLMLVPDPQKNAKYLSLAREWPLSLHLWKPPNDYFRARREGSPDAGPATEMPRHRVF